MLGRGQGLVHDVQDGQPALLGLGQALLNDLEGQAEDLDVHLDGRDALAGSGHLEIHVAEMVFQTLDVGQDGVLGHVLVGNQPQGHARAGALQGHARVHQGQRAAANRGHGGGTVGFQDVGGHLDGVGKIVVGREQGLQGPFGQVAMADLAPSRARTSA